MAVYTTPPGTRFDLGIDGTQAFIKADSESTWVEVTSSLASIMQASAANQINRTLPGGSYLRLRLLFPEQRSILGLRWSGWTARSSYYNLGARYSTDTTDGTNGAWTALSSSGGQGTNGANSIAALRTAIASQSLSNVLGLELYVQETYGGSTTGAFNDLQIYGQRSATGDHLQFWHPTIDQPLTAGSFDYGDISRGVVQAARQFRLKNVSAAKTAQTITLAYSDLDGVAFGDIAGQVSLDNSAWASSVTVPNLAAGAISSVLYTRVGSLSTRNPGPAAGRLRATVGTWA